MPAYMIIAAKIGDRERFVSGYGRAAAELVARFGVDAEHLIVEALMESGVIVSPSPSTSW